MNTIDHVPVIARSVFASEHVFDHLVTQIEDDDCGVISAPSGFLVLSTDLMNRQPALMTLGLPDRLYNYGYLMASANLSDLYGSGGKPIAMLVGLMAPSSVKESEIRELLQGVQDCCSVNKVPVVGGDTKRSDHLQGYAVGIGWAESKDSVFTRNGARVGQDVFLSGPVGDFNAAVFALTTGDFPSEWTQEIQCAIARPQLRRELSTQLSANRLATGGIDISDGLGMDVRRLAKQSKVSITIDAEAIPVGGLARKVAHHYKLDPLALVFATGGDWQFGFTCNQSYSDACSDLGGIRVGYASEGHDCWLNLGESAIPLPTFGHSDDRNLDFGEEISIGIEQFMTLIGNDCGRA